MHEGFLDFPRHFTSKQHLKSLMWMALEMLLRTQCPLCYIYIYFIVSCMSQNIMLENILFFYSKMTCLVKMVNYLK